MGKLTSLNIHGLAHMRAVDYKPWSDDCTPQEYYQEGYKVGFTEAQDRMYTKGDLRRAWGNGRQFEVDSYGGEGITLTGAETFEEYFEKLL